MFLSYSIFTFSIFIGSFVLCLSNFVVTCSSSSAPCKETSESLTSCDFEIFGTVQGVSFRKYTHRQATKLNLVGWIKNAESGTVKGHMEGRSDDINQMKNWLRTKGSPKSKITKAEFSNEKTITQLSGKSFIVNK